MITKVNIKSFLFKAFLAVTCLSFQTNLFAQRDLYLVIGQSNTAGRGDIEAQDMVALTGVDLYNGTSWESAVNIDPATNNGDGGMNRYSTIRNTSQTQGLSYAYTFGKMVNDISGNQVGLVVNARGGTNINDWAQGATAGYYSAALTSTNAALALGGSQLKGILWHQGESNRNDAAYLSKITALITAFRTDLSMPNLPFFIGELSQQRTDNGNFNDSIKKLVDVSDPAYVPFTAIASSDGLNTSDQTHFVSNGQRVLGYRYAAKALEMIYGYTYVQNQVLYVTQDAYVRGGSNGTIAQHPLESDIIRVKETSTSVNNTRRGLLEFDMSTISATANLQIVDASLFVEGNGQVASGPMDISFYDLAPTWTEASVTFNSAPAFTSQLAASTTTFSEDTNDDDNDGDSDELIHGGADITEFINDKYTLGATQIALGLKSESDGSPQFKFSTKEDLANFALRPRIVVSYLDLTCPPVTGTDVQAACDTYTWIDGVTYTASNNTATHTLVAGSANGCDSIVTLDLTINTAVTGTDVQTACGTYTWIDGVTYTASNYTATHTIVGGAATGCDSIVTLDLTINNATTGTDVQTACSPFTWIDGITYGTANNTATFTIVGGAATGCDSIVTLDLTFSSSVTGTDVQTACETFTWIDGVTYTASNNTATHTLVASSVNGCDSIVTLDLTINNATSGTDVQTACDTYTWIDGVTYTASNNTATFTIVGGAATGCDSIVTLDLTINNSSTGTDVQTACDTYTWIDGITYTASNNTATHTIVGGAANGCDSIVTLDLTINNSATGTDVQTACDTYTWIDGITYTASNNTATHTIVGGAANGCDSIVTLDLTINYSATGTDVQTACETFTWIDGVTYTASNNTATHTIVGGAASGCDSIVTLDLTINNATTGTDVQTACGTFTWIDGVTYTASNNTATFTIVGGAATGCDSIVTLDLTINNATTGTDVQIACGTFTWIDGVTYTASNNTATHTIIGGAANGCDSVVTLDLTINNATTGTDVQTACETFTWIDGVTYTASNNTATHTIVGGAANGCDSIVTLDLTINNATTGTDVQTACDTYTWIDGVTYTASNNTATFTIVGGAATGCDSIVTLDLTINTVNTNTTVSGITITADGPGTDFQWIDCDNGNMHIAGETNQSFTPTANGNYAVIISTLNCSDTSACTTISTIGLVEFDAQSALEVYPNPSRSTFTIESDLLESAKSISVVSIEGKMIYQNNSISTSTFVLDAKDWTPGVYVLTVETAQGMKIAKLIKE